MADVHIFRGTNIRYVARFIRPYERKFEAIGKPVKSSATALRRLTELMADIPHTRLTGEVIMTADYYAPVVVYELKRK